MDITTSLDLVDQATAEATLVRVREDLRQCVADAEFAVDNLRQMIVVVRPTGLLTVDQMAEAIGHDRNYVDSVWSNFGETRKGKQTRAGGSCDVVQGDALEQAWKPLADASRAQVAAAAKARTARAERDRVVAMVYASKLLGPSAIAAAVDVDRNHVLRIARKAGVAPVHRTGTRNQYTVELGSTQ